jgi:hypothetical protein
VVSLATEQTATVNLGGNGSSAGKKVFFPDYLTIKQMPFIFEKL